MTKTRRETPLISNFSLTLLVAACGGGGSGTSTSTEETSSPRSQSRMVTRDGRVVDGPIVGAIVYVDTNENGAIDDSDVRLGTTDEEGKFSGEVNSQHADKPILADLSNAYDTDAPDEKLSGLWRAPSDASVISPLTEYMFREGLSARELALRVGLPSNIDISKLDPLEISPENVAYAQQILAIGPYVAEYLNDDDLPDIFELTLNLHENHPRNKAVLDLRGSDVSLTAGYGDNDAFEVAMAEFGLWTAPIMKTQPSGNSIYKLNAR